MEQKRKNPSKNLAIGGLLTALGILIPMVMPAKIIIGPASFTLASHVPVMAAMFFSPAMAAVVAIGTTIGFMISIPVPTIWLRALMHLFAMTAGAYVLKKKPDIINHKVQLQIFNILLGIVHAGLETIVVWVFYSVGFQHLDQHSLMNLLLLIGFGGLVQSFIDFNIALYLCKVLSKKFNIDIFKRAQVLLSTKKF
ncbi:hypothetical protein ACFO26_00530 [Lactococcus nasutitermitis]|uniref:Niacin transporter NiaX n=1 Tax=Lactococcus nasutitermitis TaxID=1652957 RepID=A0ABV9JDD1_9LACT|nr:hypothetical protein [Lactococcus nasutitermitis]